MSDLRTAADLVAARVSRIRVDGGDPREANRSAPRLVGYSYPPDRPAVATAWLTLMNVTPFDTNNSTAQFQLTIALSRQNVETAFRDRFYRLLDPSNPFGAMHSIQRDTYVGLEDTVGGAAFADAESDQYDLGVSATSLSGFRWFTVEVTDIAADEGIITEGGTPVLVAALMLDVHLPID